MFSINIFFVCVFPLPLIILSNPQNRIEACEDLLCALSCGTIMYVNSTQKSGVFIMHPGCTGELE